MTEYGKMKGQKPRLKKERKIRNHPQITGFWGRGASEHRPGLFTKSYLMQHPESSCADIFRALRENLEGINRMRVETGEKPIRGCTYNSFAKYWHWFKLLGLIEPVGREETSIYDFLEERVFYRLTVKGKAEEEAWQDPVRAAHPEFR
jgi:hypothetical protein